MQIKKDGQYYYLHSKYNPTQGSKTLIDQLIKENDHYDIIFCGGFCLGYYIQYIYENKKVNFTKLIIVEKDLNIFKKALELFDFTTLLKDNNITILHSYSLINLD